MKCRTSWIDAYLKEHFGLTAEDYCYRSMFLLIIIQAILGAMFLLVGTLNVLLFGYFDAVIIALQLAVPGLYVLLFAYHHRTRNTVIVSLATIGIFAVVLIAYIWTFGNNNGSVFGAILIPPIAYFLLGGRRGTLVTVAVIVAALAALYWSPAPAIDPERSARMLVANFGLLVTFLIMIIAYYEHSRKSAHEALVRKNTELERLSVTDRLTSLYNRTHLDAVLAAELQRAVRTSGPFSLMILDIDHFKEINDTHGHPVGDAVLRGVARVMQQVARATDTVGRWGGEEFLILCPNTDLDGCAEFAERIRIEVGAEEYGPAGHRTVSIGVAAFRVGDSTESLLLRADGALYHAKNSGRNRVEREQPSASM
ncbi:GGDEF domain-containing protein [Candidatus Symbiobacter mobilis]|uniref:diguanylate cyclase n=1 Tax=Candidatus Symbiobacter mobilis CR TaxID=946483 RepID=U5N979_9BURK|nr:GGDEF domain-containing protein [Candidatus Symbiobacter mobilis]AGX86754.1 GGDEF domain protein [Candidatus Symbiobacter mobilis CR]